MFPSFLNSTTITVPPCPPVKAKSIDFEPLSNDAICATQRLSLNTALTKTPGSSSIGSLMVIDFTSFVMISSYAYPSRNIISVSAPHHPSSPG